MKINVELKSVQTIEKQEEKQIVKTKGEIKTLEKGTIIEFVDKKIKYKIIILQEKIILNKNNEQMIFEIDKTTKSNIKTQYGDINIIIYTKNIEIKKENGKIIDILLNYQIKLEEQISYQNKVEIKISY